jgi:ubiquitin carboxyl-terminal hydrolase 30
LRHQIFDNLSLTVSKEESCHLLQLFKDYTRSELIHDYKCDNCYKNDGSLSTVSKSISLVNLPRCLCLHMQRSVFLPYGISKNHCSVTFPMIVQLESILEPIFSSHGEPLVGSVSDLSLDEPKLEFIPPADQTTNKRYVYTLSCAILHYGSHDSGHFVAIRKYVKNNRTLWYRVSDESVTLVDESIFSGIGKNVYMLFYESLD